MTSSDPPPVDIDGNFTQVAQTLKQKLLANGNIATMTVEQQQSLLLRTLCSNPWLLAVLEDPEWQRSMREAHVPATADEHEKVTPEVAQQIRPGDVLNVSYYKLPHKVIVESCNLIGRGHERMVVQAIHYGRLSLLHSVTVMREQFELDCDGASVWLHKFPNSVCYTAEETLARAVSRLGERQHHPTGNNAAALAYWCKVRDYHRNRDRCEVPRCEDDGRELHQLQPGDHINVQVLNRKLHAVLTAVESLDDANDRKILGLVAHTEDLEDLSNRGLRVFTKASYEVSSGDQIERLRVPFHIRDVRKNAARLANAGLCWDSSELQAMTFLATGVSAVPAQCPRWTVDACDLMAGHVIVHEGRVQFVLDMHLPKELGQSVIIDTVQYAPLRVNSEYKSGEMRLLVSLKERKQTKLVRHCEPDLQCPVLVNWALADAPLVTEKPLEQVSDLKPGDAVCIREDTAAYPMAPEMPGLHAIVKTVSIAEGAEDVNGDANDGPSVEVICYTVDDYIPVVGIRRVPVKGHQFSKLEFNVSNNLLADREDALQRALARLGTGQYCCSWSNSRDLVRWCCVNHKANAPFYVSPVRRPSDLLALPALGQTKLRLEDASASGDSRHREVRLVGASSWGSSGYLTKLSVTGVTWEPSTVHIVKVSDMQEVTRMSRVQFTEADDLEGDEADALKQLRSDTINALLDTSLVNASDRRLGAGVSARDFCAWFRHCRRPGLLDLPSLLCKEANPTEDWPSLPSEEAISDPRDLRQWDYVIIERPQKRPLHLLVLEFNSEAGDICGYTYGPGADWHGTSRKLDMFVYFPPQGASYPMHRVIQRLPVANDASSQLSASLAAASHFPHDAAAWVEAVVLELESDELPNCPLSRTMKLMLRFAFQVAAATNAAAVSNDGSVEACAQVLASASLVEEAKAATGLTSDTSTRRLFFLMRLISCLLKSANSH